MRKNGWISLLVAVTLAVGVAACAGEDGEADFEEFEDQPSPPPPAGQTPAGQQGQVPTGPLPEGVTQEMVAQGQQVFTGQGNCYTCHGPDATGTQLAPNLTDSEWLNIDGSFEQIVQNVRTGVAQPVQHPAPMPPMGGAQLSEDQIRAVAAYVYAISHGS